MQEVGYNEPVFINCPFDNECEDIFRAIVFSVYRCGFLPVTAKFEDNASDTRISKIEKIIENCRYGIHDLSRTALNERGLPRYNMPFELGLFCGARRFGDENQKNKNALILDISPYRYLEFISDLRGADIKAHNNDSKIALVAIRNWLKTSSKRATITGENILLEEYNSFCLRLPDVSKQLNLDLHNIPFNDYCYIVGEEIDRILNS